MGKSLRSSRTQANKSQLRSDVFRPVDTARKERLSAKLIELASHPQQTSDNSMKNGDEEEGTIQEKLEKTQAHVPADENDMEINQAKQSSSTADRVPRKTSRIHKPCRGRTRAALIFPIYKKGKRVVPRMSAMKRTRDGKP